MVMVNRIDGIDAIDRALVGRIAVNRFGLKCDIRRVWISKGGAALCYLTDLDNGKLNQEFLLSVVKNSRNRIGVDPIFNDLLADIVMDFDLWGESELVI